MPTAVTQQAVHFVKPFKPSATSVETWSRQSIEDLFNLPFNDLLYKAQQIHREHFNPNEVQLSTLLSIKTGGCPEDCGYCPQSVHYDTGVEASKMLDVDAVKAAAVEAKKNGASRFCMGAAWREPKDRDIEKVAEETPEKILRATIDPLVGPQPYQGRELAFKLGLSGDQIKQFVKIFPELLRLLKFRIS